ncbi:MAG: response regulator [Proteobacteria bacterium]|nr:response regulator [Pseudomonadota bacterium]
MCAYISKVITFGGATVLEAADGKEAVKIATAEKIDLVLMDIKMPHMDGIEASRIMKEKGVGPILMASSSYSLLTQAAKEPFLAEGYIEKPFSATVLLEEIIKLLSDKIDN